MTGKLSWHKWEDGSLSLRDDNCVLYAKVKPEVRWLSETFEPAGYKGDPCYFDSEEAAMREAELRIDLAIRKEPIR